jgi:hypothetical protein
MDYQKQLQDLKQYIEENPEFDFPIDQYKLALKLKEKISKLPGKGTKCDLKKLVDDHSEEVEQEKKTFISYLTPKDFSIEELKEAQMDFLKEFIGEAEGGSEEEGLDEINKYIDAIENEPGTFDELLSLALSNRPEVLKDLKIAVEVDPALLYGLTTTLIQPVMEELGNLVGDDVKDSWWQRTCPVCDKETTVAKLIQKKRYFHCNYCHTEYHVDFNICNHCDNTDQHKLAYYNIEGEHGLEIDYCKECSHYFKLIDIEKLNKPIPQNLEDILTLRLDLIAQKEGLKRIG